MQLGFFLSILSLAALSTASQEAGLRDRSDGDSGPRIILYPKRQATVFKRQESSTTLHTMLKRQEATTTTVVTSTQTPVLSTSFYPTLPSPLPLTPFNSSVNFATLGTEITPCWPPTGTGFGTGGSGSRITPTPPYRFTNSTVAMPTAPSSRSRVTATAIRTVTVTRDNGGDATRRPGWRYGGATRSIVLPDAGNVPTSIPALGAEPGPFPENSAVTSAADAGVFAAIGTRSVQATLVLGTLIFYVAVVL
ncbi:hypothetical protein BROUX41_006345 [Berkeleyomyces rouxiae]|uniref:uncharacterized protein n=1 Tax=Berkeleyomyces rouxiae TaxID=2035830 RepID=UPI003B77FF33